MERLEDQEIRQDTLVQFGNSSIFAYMDVVGHSSKGTVTVKRFDGQLVQGELIKIKDQDVEIGEAIRILEFPEDEIAAYAKTISQADESTDPEALSKAIDELRSRPTPEGQAVIDSVRKEVNLERQAEFVKDLKPVIPTIPTMYTPGK